MSESEKRWQATCFFCCLPLDIRGGGGGGVAAWRSSYCEHDPGWRSAAADADDLCHWGGFQDSALTAALTSQGKHTPTQTHTHTHTPDKHIRLARTRRESGVPVWPTLIILSLSNRWQGFPGCHLCGWPLFRGGSLGSTESSRLARCPIYKWAVLSLTSSEPKMSCLHLARVQSPFQDGSSSLSLQRGR